MKYRQHNDALVAYPKVDAVWKTLRNGFAHIAMNDGKLLGCGRNAGQQQTDFGEKLKTQTSAFFFVPVASIINSRRACHRKTTDKVIAASEIVLQP